MYSALKFIFEIKNNNFPLVMMTNLPYSPMVMLWEEIKLFVDFNSSDNLYQNLRSFEEFIEYNELDVFTQYCSFTRKKSKDKNNQLMAYHPDNLYSAFSKMLQYCDDSIEIYEKKYKDEYNRSNKRVGDDKINLVMLFYR